MTDNTPCLLIMCRLSHNFIVWMSIYHEINPITKRSFIIYFNSFLTQEESRNNLNFRIYHVLKIKFLHDFLCELVAFFEHYIWFKSLMIYIIWGGGDSYCCFYVWLVSQSMLSQQSPSPTRHHLVIVSVNSTFLDICRFLSAKCPDIVLNFPGPWNRTYPQLCVTKCL